MNNRLLTFTTIIGLSLLSFHGNGQTTLTDLVNYSLAHSRDIKKSELQVQEADYMRKEAIGYGLPQVEASASYSKMIIPDIAIPAGTKEQLIGMADLLINESATPDQRQTVVNSITGMLDKISSIDALYTASAGIQITQLIYSQSYWVGLKTTKKTQELYSILNEKNEEDLIAEVATGYYLAGSLMLQLQTVDKSISNLKEIHRIAELSYQNDLIKESQVNRLKVTISNLEVTRQTITNGVTIQLNYLKALAGMPGDSVLAIDSTNLINDFVNKDLSSSFAVDNVPAYQAMLKQEEIYGQQVKLSKAKFYPTLAAFGKLNYSSYNTEANISDWSNMNTFGFSFSMPIFSSGVNYYKLKQSQLKQAQLHEDIDKTKDLLTVSYNNAYLEYQTANNLLAAQRENKELAQKVYDQTAMQYQEGMASMADLLNVNSDFLQADNSFNQQILKCKTAEIKMLKASGNLKSLIN
jgi:outer membrane protein